MAAPDQLYRGVTRIVAVLIAGFGAAILVVTIVRGGGVTSFGILIGALFVALGVGRFYLSLKADA